MRLFSNGAEYRVWDDMNCCRCRKGWIELDKDNQPVKPGRYGTHLECELQEAISSASIDDGTVSREIADRTGYVANRLWRCKEFERDDR